MTVLLHHPCTSWKTKFMRKVIVTGGNGFIGSSLVQRLVASGVEVHALVNENHQRLDTILPKPFIHVLQDGVSSVVDLVTRLEPDTIFHLAAVYAEPSSAQSVLSMVNGNLTLGACLLFAATQCSRQPIFINTGTYWQFDSNSVYSPNTLYAATKHAFQDLLHFYRNRSGIASVTLVLYDTFGQADTRPKLWHRLTTASVGQEFRLSAGEQTIHLIHIDDTVAAFFRAAELLHEQNSVDQIYSVPSANPVKLRTLVEALNITGKLGLDLQWGVLPYWHGQIFEPWVGQVLPGWTARVEVLSALLDMAEKHRRTLSNPPYCADAASPRDAQS
jgi:nucleoside-diphosphate-sugar epimerase